MKKTLTLFAVLVFSTAFVMAQDNAETKKENVWQVDGAHSSIAFKVSHMVVSKTKGNFDKFDGEVYYDGKSFENGKAEFTIDVASIDTDNEKRDDHLRSADFFDAEKYPKITFVSKKIVTVSDRTFQIIGDLTIKDVTKEVTFDAEFNGAMKDPWGNNRAGFSATTTIDRSEFNITWNKAIETGGLVVGNEVEISLELELVG